MPYETFDGASGAILESIPRDVSELATTLAVQESPFLSYLMSRPMYQMVSTQLEYHDYTPRVVTATRATGAQDTAADVTVSVTAGQGSRFRVGDILRVEGTAERMLVTAVSTDDLTVTRGYGGTTAATIASGATIVRISNCRLEGAAFIDTGNLTPAVRTNFSQIISEGFEITGTLMATPMVAGVQQIRDHLQHQLTFAIRTCLQQLAGAVVAGAAPASTTQGSASVRRSMDGIIETVRANTANGSNYVNISATDFNSSDAYRNLISHLRTAWDSGAKPNALICSSRTRMQLSQFMPNFRTAPADVALTMGVDSFKTPEFGELMFFTERQFVIPNDTIIMLNTNDVQLAVLRPFQTKLIGVTGDAQRLEVLGEYSALFRNAAIGSIFVGHSAAA